MHVSATSIRGLVGKDEWLREIVGRRRQWMNGFERVFVTNGTSQTPQKAVFVTNGTDIQPQKFVIVTNLSGLPHDARVFVTNGTATPPQEAVFVSNFDDLRRLGFRG
jgi:hypothetical protein